ncbi:phosphatidylserine decarboxylase-domain-containing protein [Lenzites betulinus]|nr:phosphatidylserine decarboxylase-domain-containing protein [Lenzites betulinus]
MSARPFTSAKSDSDPAFLTIMAGLNLVDELRGWLDNKPDVKVKFQESFNTAKTYELIEFKNISTLGEYFDLYETNLKWVPQETQDGQAVLRTICMFYFVLSLPPIVHAQSPILPFTKPPYTWLSTWIIRYAKQLGQWMDNEDSISANSLAKFFQAPSYHMEDYTGKDTWTTFNKFFARELKKGLRPIADKDNDKVITSPVDGTFDGGWQIQNDGVVQFIKAKGIPWPIATLLDDTDNSQGYAAQFAGGMFCHSFLRPNDYHRQHAPVSGTIIEATLIEGLCYLEVEVVKDGTHNGLPHLGMRRNFDTADKFVAPNTPGYQFIQARALILIQNSMCGLVAVLPIGMAQVSSVVLSVKRGDHVEKGQEMSYFQFGGSDVVMIFQAGANVSFTAKTESHYKYGQQIGLANPI